MTARIDSREMQGDELWFTISTDCLIEHLFIRKDRSPSLVSRSVD